MTRSLAAAALLAASLALPAETLATPLDATRVPAVADGVGHIDMDALRKTTLHRLLAPKIQKDSDWYDDVDKELRPLLRALLDTAQGVSFWLTDDDVGAVAVRVTDPKRIQLLLDKLPRRTTIRVANQSAYKFSTPDKHGRSGDDTNLVAMVGNLLLLADDEKSLGRAIDAAAGRGATLASAKKVPAGALEQGVFFFAALNNKILDHVKDAAQSATLRLNLSSLTVHVSEIRSDVRARVKLILGSPDEATKIKSMVDGLVALASMSDDAAEARAFLKKLQITVNGRTLEVAVSLPAAELVKIIESKT